MAQIFASTSGSDSDWIVKLIDVYPETYPENPQLAGYELMIADEIMRGRFRESFEHPKAVTPEAVMPYLIDLHTNDHAFLKGHRIMVQIQSTWFPLYDANPQTSSKISSMRRPPTTKRLPRQSIVRRKPLPTSSFRSCPNRCAASRSPRAHRPLGVAPNK